jgi:hypothetical protein
MKSVLRSVCAAAFVLLCGAPGFAQTPAARNAVAAGFSLTEFDLSGVGTARGVTLRASRALTDHVAIEGSLPMAWLNEDFGKSRLFAPEAQLQYHWRVRAFRPYVGGGAGMAWRDRGVLGHSSLNLTLSVAGGTRVDLTDRLALVGEVRLRGVERDFAGSTTDITTGVSWRW